MILRLAVATSILLASPLSAQAPRPVAYPQDLNTTTSNWSAVPFGFGTSRNADEVRTQVLVPREYLPSTGGTVVGLALTSPNNPGPVAYRALEIRLGHLPAVTRSLSPTFADNFPVQGAPEFRMVNSSISYSGTGWTDLMFQTPFQYDGTQNLVIDVVKLLRATPATSNRVTHSFHGSPNRFDLPNAVFSRGPQGSGAATVLTASEQSRFPHLRLLFSDVPTTTVRSPRTGSTNRSFRIGAPVEITAYSDPGTIAFHLIDTTGTGANLAAPLSIPGFFEGTAYVRALDPATLFLPPVPLPNSGEAQLTINLPNNPLLVGQRFCYQTIFLQLNGTLTLGPASVQFVMN